ncbi:hypothetical protein [Clostridium sp. DJ247]|uniref:hypothetical protein n=1 Tax=Clostridium sp. DJ247 TaxID=2726188 RepID=UPI001628C304|nr:hypothetical protein [Clostridium sp. DJ247]MBC2578775.1 hypothetical protein [Clostridium sp. DJ247]
MIIKQINIPVKITFENSSNDKLYNYLNDVSYGMSKPQFNHLTSIVNGLINLPSIKTLSKIAASVSSAKDKSCIYKFLSRSKWDDSLLSNYEKVYCLMDSWYTNSKLIEASLSRGYHLIGVVKSNRKISPLGISLQLSEFEKYITPNTLDLVTVKGKDYRVYTYEGNIAKFPNAKVLICYEVNRGTYKSPVYLMSTDILIKCRNYN